MTRHVLAELHIESLGVIDRLTLLLEPGLTALTGETGAGKTMIVDAIELLLGGRADPSVVRHGAAEARVEGRFVAGDDEHVVARVVPTDGRSRAYIDGRLATAASLAELTATMVELHGQHSHRQLVSTVDQRAALDAWAGVDLGELQRVRGEIRAARAQLDALGGDSRERARQLDLLQYQSAELHRAALDDPDEDDRLAAEAEVLSRAEAIRDAAAAADQLLRGDGGALDAARSAIHALAPTTDIAALDALAGRVRAAVVELDDVADELRRQCEAIADDPGRADAIRRRRQELRDLQRKYGDSLAEVIDFRERVDASLLAMAGDDEHRSALDAVLATLADDELRAARTVAETRAHGAAGLAGEITRHLHELGMAHARVAVAVDGPPPGDDVTIQLAANPGSPLLPIAKSASGGELARIMLATRLVLSADPGTMVFDEVDVGIGGATASIVASKLAALAERRQVLVVTHLAQVAAVADHHLVVDKSVSGGVTTASASPVDGQARVDEVARLLSGKRSATALAHAAELIASRRR